MASASSFFAAARRRRAARCSASSLARSLFRRRRSSSASIRESCRSSSSWTARTASACPFAAARAFVMSLVASWFPIPRAWSRVVRAVIFFGSIARASRISSDACFASLADLSPPCLMMSRWLSRLARSLSFALGLFRWSAFIDAMTARNRAAPAWARATPWLIWEPMDAIHDARLTGPSTCWADVRIWLAPASMIALPASTPFLMPSCIL